ncbi:hypothetical protein [Paenibacillus ottowii]|uniref:Uncharacterized protein n=1 Tax=Paenibacillus ottowii TaxID=2315729 RepID=A0ABY3B604_9BACL|nr:MULTISPECIES: hypothetical protein [Paenibacillus]NEU28896.1 hypothetical protein [Paenibacillus polymyxa]OBA04784.1 hypothetical protein A9P44_16750 [Paenibacillus polymyxa]TQR98286.1 hypothetical protein FKV70_14135 [Paenibacillus ottowii]
MDYFLLKQDVRYTNVPALLKVRETIDPWKLYDLRPEDIVKPLMFHVKADAESIFIDYLEGPIPLFSDALKRLIQAYMPELPLKLTILTQIEQKIQKNYYIPFIAQLKAVHPESEWNVNQNVIRNLVLHADAIRGHKIFRVQESAAPLIVVRLDVAESILRRDFTGISLEQVRVK